MSAANHAVAAQLAELADLLSVTGGEAFKARVYEKAARAIAGHPGDVSTMDLADLKAIPNVGGSIAEKVLEFVASGSIRTLESLRARIPAGVLALTRIPTLGPKKAVQLYEELGIASVEQLREAIDAGRLDGQRGF